MTRKEALLARKYELQNTLRILRGEDPYDHPYVGRKGWWNSSTAWIRSGYHLGA